MLPPEVTPIICTKLTDPGDRVPGSSRINCAGCGVALSITPAGRHLTDTGEAVPSCEGCANIDIDSVLLVTPEQMDEMARYLQAQRHN